MTRATVFFRIHLFRRILEIAFPALRRRREARLKQEIHRLCTRDLDEPVIFRE